MKYGKIFSLKGKVAVVAGSAGLIGREIVKGLAECGADVIAADIREKKNRKVKKRISGRYLDITKEESVLSLIDFIDERYGKLDIWVNCAYPRTRDWGNAFEKVSLDSWRKNVDMHLNGYFICCKNAAEYMKKRKSGSIINFGSIYGILGPQFSVYKGTKMTVAAPYSAIKGGIINFTRYLASYYGKYNIRVNCVSPGGVYEKQNRLFIKQYKDRTPLGRMADKEDIIGGALYMASDASKYVTGHNLIIDGGWSII